MSAIAKHPALSAAGISFIERGWLSANNIYIEGEGPTALIDTGYCTHAEQTLALVDHAAQGRRLDMLLNTHLHSDHCGGNAALQARYPDVETRIPPGLAEAVARWDPVALTFAPTGQQCPPFSFQGVLQPGTSIKLGSLDWEIHAAKGHDPHAVILFQPQHGVLVSADALWESGFGVVFPELEGRSAFDEVGETLDVIEALAPQIVLPGHGSPFTDLHQALLTARARLAVFTNDPGKHLRHGWKVLIKYKLLEWQQVPHQALLDWTRATPYLAQAMPSGGKDQADAEAWLAPLLSDLQRSGALRIENSMVINA